MEAKAELKQVSRDYRTKKFQLTFQIEGDITNALDDITGKPLRLKAVQWREKRSLDSNAYMWVLTSKIAQKVGSTPEAIHRKQMNDYAPLYMNEGNAVWVTLKAENDVDKLRDYWRFYKQSKDGRYKSYFLLMHSSDFNTKEMSDFLQKVIEEAKELGIEAATPEELERMEQLYEQSQKRAGG